MEPNKEYNEEENYWDDGYLPDGEHHEKFPVTKEAQKQADALQNFFNNAWIH